MINSQLLSRIKPATRRRAIVCFLGIFLCGLVFVLFCPRRYDSEAKLFVRLGRESVGMDPTATATGQQQSAVSYSSGRDQEINSIVQMLDNYQIFEHVVDELSPEVVLEWESPRLDKDNEGDDSRTAPKRHWTTAPVRFFSHGISRVVRAATKLSGFHEGSVRDDAVDLVNQRLRIRSPRRSSVIEVSYRSNSPLLSHLVVQTVVDYFLESHPKWNRAENSTEFFEQQVSRANQELHSLQEKLAEKKSEFDIASVTEFRNELTRQLSELDIQLMTDRRQLDAAERKLAALQMTLKDVAKDVVSEVQSGIADNARDTMRGQLYELELQERDLSARYNNDYPALLAVRQQITAASQLLQDTRDERSNTTRALNPIRTQVETELALQQPEVESWRARVASLEKQRLQLCQRIGAFNRGEIDLAALTREVDLAEGTFQSYVKRLEEARVDHALQNQLISNVNVVQRATFLPEAVFPKEVLSLLGFALIGLCAAGWIVWRSLASDDNLITSSAEASAAWAAPVVGRLSAESNDPHVNALDRKQESSGQQN